MRKISTLILTAVFLLVMGIVPVMAETKEVCTTNAYGETTCSTTTEDDVVVHEPTETAIGDNPTFIAALFGMAGMAFYTVSKKAEN